MLNLYYIKKPLKLSSARNYMYMTILSLYEFTTISMVHTSAIIDVPILVS